MTTAFIVGVLIAWLVIRWSVQWYFEQRGWVTVEPLTPPRVVVRMVERARLLPERAAQRWLRLPAASPVLPQEQVLDADVLAEEVAPPPTDEEAASAASVIEIVEEASEEPAARVVTPPAPEPAVHAVDEGEPAEDEPLTLTPSESPAEAAESVPAPLFLYVEAYCPTCRTQRPLVDPEETAPDDEHKGVRGLCPICGGELFATL